MTVADLLTASRASHAAYRQLHDDAAKVKAKKPEGWQAHLWDALTLRRQAHAADPDHRDLAWSDDKASHADLMAFYEQQLGLQTTGG